LEAEQSKPVVIATEQLTPGIRAKLENLGAHGGLAGDERDSALRLESNPHSEPPMRL